MQEVKLYIFWFDLKYSSCFNYYLIEEKKIYTNIYADIDFKILSGLSMKPDMLANFIKRKTACQ